MSGLIATAVSVTDEPGRIHHQNKTLGVVQDLAGKIPFPLELGLKVLQFRDVQHHAAVLHYPSLGVFDREHLLQTVNDGTVLAPQHFLKTS